MFDMIGSLVKATVGAVVQTPVAIVADVVTLGGTLVDRNKPFTQDALGNVVQNLENSVKPSKQ